MDFSGVEGNAAVEAAQEASGAFHLRPAFPHQQQDFQERSVVSTGSRQKQWWQLVAA